MLLFGLYFSVLEMIILGVLLIAFFFQLYFYLCYLYGVLRYLKKVRKKQISYTESQPPVSVIICAKDEEKHLSENLPLILAQNYPKFEVIVINDGSTDETETILRDLTLQNHNLRTTFVPSEANNYSTKKLGLTLGVKAAKYDYLVFTEPDCKNMNNNWLAGIMQNFDEKTDIVLGYCAIPRKKGFLNLLIAFDNLFSGLKFLGMSIFGATYMGDGRNLAYKKDVFYTYKGFASILNLQAGEDDIIVNRASNKVNTKIEARIDGIIETDGFIDYPSWLYYKKNRYLSSLHYKRTSTYRITLELLSRFMFYTATIVLLVIGSQWLKIISLSALFLRYLIQLILYAKIAKPFKSKNFVLLIFPFDVFLLLLDIQFLLFGVRIKKRTK